MRLPPPRHLLSVKLDPVFAVVLGLCSAAIRVRREESEKVFGRYTMDRVPWKNVYETGERRLKGWWNDTDDHLPETTL